LLQSFWQMDRPELAACCRMRSIPGIDPEPPITSARYWRSRCRTLDCPRMTTRQYLRARVIRLYSRIWPIVLISLVMAIWARRSALLSLLVLITISALLTAYVVIMRRAPCPRCSAPLRNAALNWGSKRQTAAHCPNCGLGIDEQVADPLPLEQVPKS
jgi:hypothetical protein